MIMMMWMMMTLLMMLMPMMMMQMMMVIMMTQDAWRRIHRPADLPMDSRTDGYAALWGASRSKSVSQAKR